VALPIATHDTRQRPGRTARPDPISQLAQIDSLCAQSPVCWAAVTRAPNRNFCARIDASHIVNIAVVRSSGLDERSMRPARPVTGSTAEAIPGRVWLG